MATVYEIKIKTVSAFANYNEKEISNIVKHLLDKYVNDKTGLKLESTEILDVKRRQCYEIFI